MLLCVRIKCVPIKYIAFLLHPEGHAPCILQTVPVARTEPVFGRNNILNFNKRFIIIISRYSFFFSSIVNITYFYDELEKKINKISLLINNFDPGVNYRTKTN